MPTVGVVVGNPKTGSRTLGVARAVALASAEAAGLGRVELATIDLAALGPRLFDWSDPEVGEARQLVRRCPLAVVASPTFKGTYTGLLKSFLDWFSTTDLLGVTAVPVMVGAAPRHALAVEVHLRPLLVELGASVPTRGLYVTEDHLDDLDEVITTWLGEAAARLRSSVGDRPGRT